ncbi:uncharacterized protein Z518_10248 [Rhinocladiella mackenziei CBS 650.93]|uniref:Altered inheritance of mitochondria protein 9, mitochondrial n=1 Tax=Rhinocladiella mackenziei CBS 650.93 TaxID=1442369 RepID=A0A0D2IA37_9EURO|nr:uncharacterized protein Z518_10248 [Rhinocladiella mackenziei CBS 650.93]KIX00111.1 hypothetical protein Z518_10248 [Rhinocladiella mackenziei CBS 650.93]
MVNASGNEATDRSNRKAYQPRRAVSIHKWSREKQQRDCRYLKFDLEALCEIATSTGPSISPVREVEKLEGGFSKALRVQKEDGMELVAKIPCPIAGPARYTTASEVAVLEYVRGYTNIPVPHVYAWSSDTSNPVGAEYIIMEKAIGVQLFKVWDKLKDISKLAIIKKLTEWESQLMAINFPAYGCLYHRHSIPDNDRKMDLPTSIDPSGSYCIGQSCNPTWSSVGQNLMPGPWPSLTEFGTAFAKREIRRISRESKSVDSHSGTAPEQIALLEIAVKLMQILSSHSDLVRHAKPTFCHTDLHMGNIFISEHDPSKISAIIDWQFTQIAPMFLQARWPAFLNPPEKNPAGLVRPKLPDNYGDLDGEEKELAEYEFKQVTAAKAYELRCYLDNPDAYNAMNIPRVYRELFIRCGETWEEGPVPLRTCLIEIFNCWQDLGLPGECPYPFHKEDIQTHEKEFEEYEEWHHAREFAKEYLNTDAHGWISPEMDFTKKQEQNKALFNLFAERMAGQK